MVKELGCFVAGLSQKAKGTFCGVVVKNVTGCFFFFIPVKVKRVMLKALVVLGKVVIARLFCEEVVQCWAWKGKLGGRFFIREVLSCIRRGGISKLLFNEKKFAFFFYNAFKMG